MRGGVGMEVERGTIRLPDTLSKDLSGEGKVELEARLLILLADPSLAPGSLLARMVMKAVAADPKAAMEVARSKHGLRALAGGLPGGSDDANKQNQGRADATARALSAVLSNLEGLELSAASKELMAAGVLGGLCRALESPQTPPGIAAHCIRALHRLVQVCAPLARSLSSLWFHPFSPSLFTVLLTSLPCLSLIVPLKLHCPISQIVTFVFPSWPLGAPPGPKGNLIHPTPVTQADDARAGEVGKACLPSLLHLLGDAEPRVGEEAARLLTAIAAATSPRREGDSAAEQEQGEDLMIEAAGRLAGVVGAASDKHTKQASALAMAAVVRAGGEAAAQVAVRGGAGAKLLGMLGGKSGRQAAAEALLELAGAALPLLP